MLLRREAEAKLVTSNVVHDTRLDLNMNVEREQFSSWCFRALLSCILVV